MYPNLRAEVARKGLTMKELAKRIGIGESTMNQKLNGKYAFTLDEAVLIRDVLEVDIPLDVLFEKVAA